MVVLFKKGGSVRRTVVRGWFVAADAVGDFGHLSLFPPQVFD